MDLATPEEIMDTICLLLANCQLPDIRSQALFPFPQARTSPSCIAVFPSRSLPYLKIFPECFFFMDLASLVAVSVVTVACSMLSLLLVNDNRGVGNRGLYYFQNSEFSMKPDLRGLSFS